MRKKLVFIFIVMGINPFFPERLRLRRLILTIGAKTYICTRSEGTSFGISGEAIFPLPKGLALRADIISLNIYENYNSLSFNQESFDLFYHPSLRNPSFYLFGGIGFYTKDGSVNYGMRAGGGINYRLFYLTRVFLEAGGFLTGDGERKEGFKLSFGIRYGRR